MVSSLVNIVETFMESAAAVNLSLGINTNFVGGTLDFAITRLHVM